MKFLIRQTPEQPIRVVDSDGMTRGTIVGKPTEPSVYFPEINCGACITYYNENENIRPLTEGASIVIGILNEAIAEKEAQLKALRNELREVMGLSYNAQRQRIFFDAEGKMGIREIEA